MAKQSEIFINTIKDIEDDLNTNYSIMFLGDTKPTKEYKTTKIFFDNTSDNISFLNKGVCEFTGMYWLWKNYKLKDYIGFCQYRKRFKNNFTDAQIHSFIDKYGIIVGQPLIFNGTVAQQYMCYHNFNDLKEIGDIINEFKPEYNDAFKKTVLGNRLYINNCFIMKKESFIEYCEFIWGIITKFIEKNNIVKYDDCIKRVIDKKNEYLHILSNFQQNSTVEYQSRFLAYLIERLTNVFINKHFTNPYETPIISVEQKYKYDTINK